MLRRSCGTRERRSFDSERPPTMTLPRVASISLSSSRIIVDLPEPDAPTRKTHSPLSICSETSALQARHVARVDLRDVLEHDHRAGRGRGLALVLARDGRHRGVRLEPPAAALVRLALDPRAGLHRRGRTAPVSPSGRCARPPPSSSRRSRPRARRAARCSEPVPSRFSMGRGRRLANFGRANALRWTSGDRTHRSSPCAARWSRYARMNGRGRRRERPGRRRP